MYEVCSQWRHKRYQKSRRMETYMKRHVIIKHSIVICALLISACEPKTSPKNPAENRKVVYLHCVINEKVESSFLPGEGTTFDTRNYTTIYALDDGNKSLAHWVDEQNKFRPVCGDVKQCSVTIDNNSILWIFDNRTTEHGAKTHASRNQRISRISGEISGISSVTIVAKDFVTSSSSTFNGKCSPGPEPKRQF